MDAVVVHRLHFAFTITYHYLFPQLTMGLALLIVVLKTIAVTRDQSLLHDAARFWARIFGINFIMGVVTGIPMEFQFGTNWSQFARVTGGVIGQPLAMDGVFSFFLESAFLGLFLFGERRRDHRLFRHGSHRGVLHFGRPLLRIWPRLLTDGRLGRLAFFRTADLPHRRSSRQYLAKYQPATTSRTRQVG